MKLKRRRAPEVPPKIRSFINNVISSPLDSIQEPLKSFVWDFEKGDFHHWVDLFNHFDSYFEKYVKPRKDLRLEDEFLDSDPPFPKEAVLQILRITRIILENCTNKHFFSSYEHLSSLLACADADVVESSLKTLATFVKKTVGKYTIRDAALSSRLFAFAQGWGCKEEGLGLTSCAVENGCDPIAHQLGCTLHFEFYTVDESCSSSEATRGLQIIHLPNVNRIEENDLKLLDKLVKEYKVPPSLRFPLFTRLRFARAFGSLASRQQYTCIRLYAFVVVVQASSDADDLTSFFNNEPEFINELVSLLSLEDAVPEKIRILSLRSLVALCQDRSRQPTVLAAVTSGGHRGILSSLMQKAIDSVINGSSKWSVVFAESLLSLVTVLVSSSSGCSAMREAGFIPTLLPLFKDTDPQHLHLVATAVHVLEAFMDYSNPAAALFRDLGGLDDTIYRLKVEVSVIESGSKQTSGDVDGSRLVSDFVASTSSALDDSQPVYSEALLTSHRRLLMKALLRAISLGTYAPGTTARIYGSEESLLPKCLCIIFRRAKDFGGGVFSLAATVMSDLIHKDPTCFSVLDAAGLPSAFMDAIIQGVVCSAEAITCIPQCLDALCLNNNGLQAVKDRNALSCFVKIFTSRPYLRALAGDTAGSLSSGLDELMRHASSLRGPAVDILIEILNTILKLGSAVEVPSPSVDSLSSPNPVPMETDSESREGKELSKIETADANDLSSDLSSANVESYLPDYVSNAARLLETILQNSDACRLFIEKKGIEALLKMFSLPLLPLSASVGQSISIAFKNFSAQHSASLARAVCSFLREHLTTTVELLDSIGGTRLTDLESEEQTKVLKCLSCLEGILSLSNSLLKGTTTVVSELGTGDADVLKDIGRVYREVLWQISLPSDSKVEEKQNVDMETENADAAASNATGRESDDDTGIPVVRYMNPVSVRSGSQSQWAGEHDFLSVIRSGAGLSRRNRHGLTRIRGGRTGRHLDAFNIDTELSVNVNEASTSLEQKKKSPDILASDILAKLSGTVRSFYAALIKSFSSPNRRRSDSGPLSSVAKNIGTALAKLFVEALSFSGHPTCLGVDVALSVKCQYLGKVVQDMAALIFDSRRRICYTALVNHFYVSGALKELLTTFEATSQLLWSLPHSIPMSGTDSGQAGNGSKVEHSSWLLDTLQSYCRLLEYFVNSSLLLSTSSPNQAQLLVQPVAIGLSIGLFPVPRDPEVFVRMLQSQVLDVVLPVWNHPMFPHCSPAFIASVLSLVTHIYSGVGDVKRSRSGVAGSSNQRVAPPLDEAAVATIVEMGFSRARAEEALRRVESNSVEMAMDWLCTHAEDPVQEDDELARALALSLGGSNETSKSDATDKSVDILGEEGQIKVPPVDDILGASMKLFQSGDSLAFPLTDMLVTLCNRNKGEDRPKVTSYLVQRLKLCCPDLSRDAGAVSSISHILALLLSEDTGAREVAAQSGIVSIAIDILKNFRMSDQLGNETFTKRISALLLILDNLLQSRPRISSENSTVAGPQDDSSKQHASILVSESGVDKSLISDACEKELVLSFEKIFGKSTGYLSVEETGVVLEIACDMLKQHVHAIIMQAVLQLCARLTKIHAFALQFLESGGMSALFNLPSKCFFSGYDTLASAIVRHLLEDPQTLQTAMELEIRQTLNGTRHGGRIPTRVFLTSMAPVISRDPVIFAKAAAAVCQLESSGGRAVVVLSKEKDKDRSKSIGAEGGLSSGDSIRMPEMKIQDGPGKGSKGCKKIPANLSQVIDQLLEIVLQFPSLNFQEDSLSFSSAMEVDLPATSTKGKSKVGEANKKVESDYLPERSAALAKVTFVLKLLSEIILMYVHAVTVVLKRDSELCQLRGSCQLDTSSSGPAGVVHHVLNKLLPVSTDSSVGPSELREKLSEKASWFLVVLCGRSGEGRRRVISELVKALSLYGDLKSNTGKSSLLPDKKALGFVELVYSVLSKNSSSNGLSVSGYSPDIARSMIDGGIVPCLTSILQEMDLDHPDAPKIANIILKALESLSRAANASEQTCKSDPLNKKRSTGAEGRSGEQTASPSQTTDLNNDNRSGEQEVTNAGVNGQNLPEEARHTESNHGSGVIRSAEQDMRHDGEGPSIANTPGEHTMEFTRDGMEDADLVHNAGQIHMDFHVENRADEDIGDEDDDMGAEGEEDDDDEDDGEDEDEDIGGDGTALMSLADTDVDDHEDTGLGDEYNDDMIDEDEDEYHENRVIEVRWREALDGFDHLQVAQSASSFIDAASEPFEGVNVDDLFSLRRTLGFERRRQTSRPFERSNTDGGIQHPLLLRQPQSGNGSLWSSGGHASRDSESMIGGGIDISHFYMFDSPALPYEFGSGSLFGDRSGGTVPPPLTDYSVGMDSLHIAGRRGADDGRWADDGQPQASNQAATIAQAVEEVFVSLLRSAASANTPVGRQSQNAGQQEQQSDALQNSNNHLEAGGTHSDGHNNEGQLGNGNENDVLQRDASDVVAVQDHVNATEEVANASHDGEPLSSNPEQCDMDSGHGNGPSGEQAGAIQEPLPSSSDLENNQHLGGDSRLMANIEDEQVNAPGNNELQPSNDLVVNPGEETVCPITDQSSTVPASTDVEMNGTDVEPAQPDHPTPTPEGDEPSADHNVSVNQPSMESDRSGANGEPPGPSAIDPTFLEALPEDLRAEVLASQQSQSVQPPAYTPPSVEDIDPEFLAALPPDIQAEVLAQQRAQRLAQQSEGQPVDMDNASIIATLPADLREEVLLTSSEAVLSALPSPLLAEAQMLRDRAMSHYQARSLFGSSHRLTNRRNGLGFDRQSVMDRGVGVTIGRRTGSSLSEVLKVKEVEGEPLLDANALKALIRLLRLAQPLGKGLLQRLLLNLCAHSVTRANLVHLLLGMIKPEAEGTAGNLSVVNPQRLYGCPPNIVYGQSQLLDGLPPLVLRRVLEVLTYLATNHSAVANTLFYFEPSLLPESSENFLETKNGKGKEKVDEGGMSSNSHGALREGSIPVILLLKLLKCPLFRRSIAHVEQVMGLLQVVIYTAASRLESLSPPDKVSDDAKNLSVKASDGPPGEDALETETKQKGPVEKGESSSSDSPRGHNIHDVFVQLPKPDLRNLCRLLGYEGLSDKVYMLAGEVLKKLAAVVAAHRKFFTLELSDLAQDLSSAAVAELTTLKNTCMMGLSAGSMAGAAMLRVLQALSSLISHNFDDSCSQENGEEPEEQVVMLKLNSALEPLWQELSECITAAESELGQAPLSPIIATMGAGDNVAGSSPSSPPLPPGTQRLLPFIEAFFVLCEKLQSSNSLLQQDQSNVTAREVKESASSCPSALSTSGGDSQRRFDSATIFSRFAEKHRRLLNAFIRQNPGLLEKSLSLMLKAPRLIDFDNKRAYFRSRIRQQHEQHLAGPLRISVRRAYVLEDSYNQLRMRSTQDLKGRLNVQFQGEEGIDAGGLTREWYQLLSRVIFDKGALLFTTVGSNATFQPNPNSVYQTEHLSYFKFVGRVVAKALFDGQLLDVYFTRSFYKHILGVKVTYHDIEAVDPDYYKNLKWMLENDVSDILDLTFSMDADEEKHILYGKTEVTDYELKPGGRNIRVTEETKHEYVDLVADHILTNAIRPQINSFLEGFNELVPRELISIFNDKELELLISGLPEIDLDDLKANTEYTGYTAASNVIQWFWEVVNSFTKEDMARFLQFVTGTSKVPLEGFKALQGISGPQRFQIHKAYGTPERLPSAHTCFNQLDLPEYASKEQLKERLLLAIHEASEGFGFG